MCDLEKSFVMFIGVLVVCLIVSIFVYNPKKSSHKPTYGGPFGYKMVDGHCILVHEVPNKKTGVYSDVHSCMESVGNPFGYNCMKNTLGPNVGYCSPVKEVPHGKEGEDGTVYSNADECLKYCGMKDLSYLCYNKECVGTYHPVDVKNKFYESMTTCNTACNPVKIK